MKTVLDVVDDTYREQLQQPLDDAERTRVFLRWGEERHFWALFTDAQEDLLR